MWGKNGFGEGCKEGRGGFVVSILTFSGNCMQIIHRSLYESEAVSHHESLLHETLNGEEIFSLNCVMCMW